MASFPVSLYFDLQEGAAADLEVAARASIAFAEGLREFAYILDPSSEVRVELISGTPGSLSIDSIIKASKRFTHKKVTVKKGDGTEEEIEKLKLVVSAALGVMLWMGTQTSENVAQDLLDHILKKDETVHLSQADKDEIAQKAAALVQQKAAQPQFQKVFREAEKDSAIRGVGVSHVPGKRPAYVVPRREFSERAGRPTVQEQTVSRRVVTEEVRVALISPVLVPGDRRWKLRTSQGEFGAILKDTDFVERVLTGRTAVPMVSGIEMDVELETTEDFVNGVWVPVERVVRHVGRLYQPPAQGRLPLPPPEYGEP